MAEENEESIPLNDRTAIEDTTAKFMNEGNEPQDVLQGGSDEDLNFSGLSKEELIPYVNDPFWRKMRLVLHVAFWIGWVTMLAAAVVIIFLAPRCPHRPDLKWYDKETVYEIFPKSFKDSVEDPRGGDGVGDIKGIKDRLNYIKKDTGSKILYLNSIYESDDREHGTTLTDHKKIASLFGTEADFEELRKETKKMEMRLIMDFIPNHTGKKSEWFLKSQKKEGKYSNYYIWAPCNPNTYSYPNNWVSVKGKRAWSYDDTRKECYYHQLESDKPDLNLWNPDVRQELESILRFWLDKGVDGFHVQNVQYLYEDKNLTDESLIPGMPGNAYDDFEHNHTVNHPENAKILQSWKAVLDSYNTKPGREKALVITADDDPSTARIYLDAGVTIVRINPLSRNGTSLAERIEAQLKDFNFGRIGWMFSDKDTSRLASITSPQQTKALLILQATLPGVPFNYYGNEIGMIDHPTLPVPLRYRTPMQWNYKGTGFSKNKSWIKNITFTAANTSYLEMLNYSYVNVETEKAYGGDDISPLKVFKGLHDLRQKESFQWGKMEVFRNNNNNGDLLMYTRRAEGFPGYLVAINFGNRKLTESFYAATEIPKEVRVVFHSHKEDNRAISLSDQSYILDPNHAVVLEYA